MKSLYFQKYIFGTLLGFGLAFLSGCAEALEEATVAEVETTEPAKVEATEEVGEGGDVDEALALAPVGGFVSRDFQGQYTIQNYSGKRLSVLATSSTIKNGTDVCVSDTVALLGYLFRIDNLGNGKYRLVSLMGNNGYCIDIYGLNTPVNGAKVHVWSPSNSGMNIWKIDSIGNNYYVIRSSLNTNLVLTAESEKSEAKVFVRTYSPFNNLQKWKLNPISIPDKLDYSAPNNWKFPWSKNVRVLFSGGYGKSDSGANSSHFASRRNTYTAASQAGIRHSIALDFALAGGTPLYAPTSGTVTGVVSSVNYTSVDGGYGNYVQMETDDGYIIIMAHLAYGSIPVTIKSGARVSEGTLIGRMGKTGNSQGTGDTTHLHFEIRDKTNSLLPYVASNNDYTPLTGIFGKPIRYWAYSYTTDWFYGGI